ncbi:MAG: cyclic nucleotide-binding domain-containing protein, partial [Desulfomonile tiedjei]|nr:cyclic nucleotide-binding domain-containing protein [Desulfomonile tiedjei]
MPAIPLPEINSIPGLAALPEPFQELISQGEALISVDPGGSIIGQDRANDDVLLVVSGHASVVLRDPHLANITVDTLAPGDIFGEIPFFTGVPWISDSDLVAEESCRVLRIPASIFERVLRDDGEFSVRVTKRLVRKIMLLNRSILSAKLRRNSLHEVISRQEHLFPDRVIGEHVRKRL